jgi:hypothetical protein
MLKKLAFAAMLMCGVATAQNTTTSIDPNQIYNTGNLVNWGPAASNSGPTSQWINGIYQQNLTCWAWGDPGNCGPLPTVTPGNINFSFGLTDIHQITNIAAALPNSGSGLRVNGYNFSFMAKNGNGWDNGQQDYLSAYVDFYGADNSKLRSDYYNLNYKFNWTTFNFNKTFDNPYASKDLSTVQYGFVGGDSNYWAGPYGPEITNISFSLKYSVDPCATNVLSSPTCPGYIDALTKLVPAANTTIIDPISTTSTSPLTTTTTTVDPSASMVTTASVTTIAQPIIIAPALSLTTSSSLAQKESNTSNTSLALSIISKNQDRDTTNSNIAQTAISAAAQVAQQAQQEAASVASNAVANSTSSNAISSNGIQSTGLGVRMNNSVSSSIVTLQNSSINNGSVTVSMLSPQVQNWSVIAPSTVIQIEQTQQLQQTTLQSSNVVTQTIESYSVVPPNFLTDKANPLTDIIEAKQNIPQNNTTVTQGASVNKNVSDNDVAGGVSISKLAIDPAGYGSYLNIAMRDASFYAPKEVYRNQRNVDNARAMRQLSSDRLHQEMVNQQYKGK